MNEQTQKLISFDLPHGWTLQTTEKMIVTTNQAGYVNVTTDNSYGNFEQLTLHLTEDQAQIVAHPHQLLELSIKLSKEIVFRPIIYLDPE
ncbi:hypothetical protein JZO70_07170 [Enterococcus sp. 669A]|uniref:Uncharacterized protein n=1 Tax=Candidatus Enterococcus moelleringii TaxID=2815325 RepID=A0ABS3L8I6_9ENTE|nr:hypothetical protein [Enterococcus sp. 669A]MBO1305934.1 hypothetical protein [Enterococcus sp. 669A]